jgi:hypothetical protein
MTGDLPKRAVPPELAAPQHSGGLDGDPSHSGFYEWPSRGPSQRATENERLTGPRETDGLVPTEVAA